MTWITEQASIGAIDEFFLSQQLLEPRAVNASQIKASISRLTRFRTACTAAAASALMAIGAAPVAHAQNYDAISTPEQRRACTPDVYRLCAGEIPNVAKITACLRRKKGNLSDACRSAMGE